MNYFLQIFGDKTVGWAIAVIAAGIFLYACYRKVEKYFSEKAIREKEKDEKIQEVVDQAKLYPQWHQQSIDIRAELSDSFKELANKLDATNAMLERLRNENGEDKATTCRYRILRFDDEIRHGTRHSKEHFDQILEDITEYERYCNDHPDYKNNKAVLAIENIKRVYQLCTNEGSFL